MIVFKNACPFCKVGIPMGGPHICPKEQSQSTEKFEKARQAYIKLTNGETARDVDTGESFYLADQEVMAALDEFFKSRVHRDTIEVPKKLLTDLVDDWEHRASGPHGSPNHNHSVPGIWDWDNGELSGKPCAQCAMYDEARRLVKKA